MAPAVNSPSDPSIPRLWNPRLARDEFIPVRHQLIDPARPELGSRPPPSPENWIWKGRIRPGDLVVIVGDTASGKTTLLCDWMARITNGLPFPGDPEHFRREPGEVLLFNGADSFVDTIQPRLAVSRADLGRVQLVTPALQAWSGKPTEIPARWETLDPAAYETRDCRSGLHRKSGQKWLANFLKNRTQVQMVVIDHLSHHLQADSERKLSAVIVELTQIARETNVVIVLSQRPNAYRNGLGPDEFLKSGELIDSARSIWRVVRPTDETVEARSLQCLKLSQHPRLPEAETPWGLFCGPRQELEWVPGAAAKHSHSKLAHEERGLFHTDKFLRHHLERAGGVAEFHSLLLAAKALKITTSWFMQTILMPEFEVDYEPVGEDELIQIIGFPEAIARRRDDPNPPPLKIKCPPGAAESTAGPDPVVAATDQWVKDVCSREDPVPRHAPGFLSTYPGDRPQPAEGASVKPAVHPAPHINLHRPSREERVEDGFTQMEELQAQRLWGTPSGWKAMPENQELLQQTLAAGLERLERQLPPDLNPAQLVRDYLSGELQRKIEELRRQAAEGNPDGPSSAVGPDARGLAPDPVAPGHRSGKETGARTPGSPRNEPSASRSSWLSAAELRERGFEPVEREERGEGSSEPNALQPARGRPPDESGDPSSS
ncbi:MAG: ATP-binding protein [Planctomycetaceae bacterium]